jgi:hypothetical protein
MADQARGKVETNDVAKPKIEQQGEECGFGHNVRAEDTFRKISSQKPKFDDA